MLPWQPWLPKGVFMPRQLTGLRDFFRTERHLGHADLTQTNQSSGSKEVSAVERQALWEDPKYHWKEKFSGYEEKRGHGNKTMNGATSDPTNPVTNQGILESRKEAPRREEQDSRDQPLSDAEVDQQKGHPLSIAIKRPRSVEFREPEPSVTTLPLNGAAAQQPHSSTSSSLPPPTSSSASASLRTQPLHTLPACHRIHISENCMQAMKSLAKQPTKKFAVVNRLVRELQALIKDPPEQCSAAPSDDNVFQWNATVLGPSGTPYENGIFHLTMVFSKNFPLKPPIVEFVTPIYHCNIDSRGSICLDVLSTRWSPSFTISDMLLYIIALLINPDPKHPLMPHIASLYRNDKAKHDEVAREWTDCYARHLEPEEWHERKQIKDSW